jgi:hypothetical protein
MRILPSFSDMKVEMQLMNFITYMTTAVLCETASLYLIKSAILRSSLVVLVCSRCWDCLGL